MITRYFDGEVPYPSPSERTPADEAIGNLAEQTIADFHAQFEQFQFSRALETAWSLVAAVNKYIVENEPWAVAERDDQDSRARLATILYTSAEALRIVTALVHPVIPGCYGAHLDAAWARRDRPGGSAHARMGTIATWHQAGHRSSPSSRAPTRA